MPPLDPERQDFLDMPIIFCPHLPRDTTLLIDSGSLPVCKLCIEDAVREAEMIVEGGV